MKRYTLYDFVRPSLQPGSYNLEATQTLAAEGEEQRCTSRMAFRVAPLSVPLPQGTIRARYPAPNATGDHAMVLPHVEVVPATLPWQADNGPRESSPSASLALAVLYEEECEDEGRVRTEDDGETWLVFEEELRDVILPPEATRHLFTHVRASGDPTREPSAFIVGHRTPCLGGSTVVHLLWVPPSWSPTDGYYRAKSLDTWRFESTDAERSSTLQLRALVGAAGGLRLPPTGNRLADRYLARGVVPLVYRRRRPSDVVAWYRGPFMPLTGDPVAERVDVLLQAGTPGSARDLIANEPLEDAQDRATKMQLPDASFAVAWQLGRSLMLASPQVFTELWRWDRRRTLTKGPLGAAHDILTHHRRRTENTMPPAVLAWFRSLARLELVPTRYLIAEPALLAPRSTPDGAALFHLFYVDQVWVRCLLMGALSVVRRGLDILLPGLERCPYTTGCIVRSPLVREHGSFDVDAWTTDDGVDGALPKHERRLAPDCRLYLFEPTASEVGVSEVKRVEAHLPAHAAHLMAPEYAPNGVAVLSGAFESARDLAVKLLTSGDRVRIRLQGSIP